MPMEQEVKNWYDQWYKAEGINTMQSYEYYPIFLDFLRVEAGKNILDVACGTGFLLKAATKRGLVTFGVDISEEAIKTTKTVSPKSVVFVGKGEDLKFEDNTFDYVTCLGALEHFLDMKQGLQQIKRVAKDNAMFCIMVPNSNYFFYKINGKCGTNQQDINEHLASLKQWKKIFKENGFEILKIYQDKWKMKQIDIFSSSNLLQALRRLLYKVWWIFLPLKYTYQFIFILRKK